MDFFTKLCTLTSTSGSDAKQQQKQVPPPKITGSPELIAQYVYNDILAVKTQIKKYNEVTGILASNNLYYKLFKLVESDHSKDLDDLKKKFEYDITSTQYKRQLVQLYKSQLNDYSNLLDIFKNNYNHGIFESNIVKYRKSSIRSRTSSVNEGFKNNHNNNINDQASSIFSVPSIDSSSSSISNFSISNSPKLMSRKSSLKKVCEEETDYDVITDEAPDTLLDPISFSLFSDPVITPSGITYEKSHLIDHLNKTGKFDPLTRTPLYENQLYPNLVVKDTVEEYIRIKEEELSQRG
ncbi:hypothetical protein DFJ63DRAFT_312956 [Scheffersomyces coipomensis]|uniref:uncharacterized protein n=1 Tax=Scheffersomyces coipomensis TaxID=1788519 RepID=UPI00315DFDC7